MGYLADQFSGKITDTIVDNRIPDYPLSIIIK